MVIAVACFKDDTETPIYPEQESVAITFDVPSMWGETEASSTRGEVKDGAFDVGDSFGVVAYHVADGSDIATTNPSYINNLCVTYGDDGTWGYTASDTDSEYVFSFDGVNYYYYLPSEGTTYFYAYYPYDASVDFSSITGYPSFDYTISSSVSEQKDMLLSAQSTPSSDGVVSLSFSHPLAQVSFGVYGTGDVAFSQIELGTLHNQGTVSIDKDGLFTWKTTTDAQTSFLATVFDGDIDSSVIPEVDSGSDDDKVMLTTTSGYLFMIPQTFSSLDIKVTTSDGAIQNLAVGEGAWQSGTAYRYNIGTAGDGDYDITYDATNDCYLIYTVVGLRTFADLVNGSADSSGGGVTTNKSDVDDSYFTFSSAKPSSNALLMNDIDLSELGATTSWTPIGDDTNNYSGSFDGNNKAIYNLYIDNSSLSYQGLFGYTNVISSPSDKTTTTEIKNIKLIDPIVSGDIAVGGIVGFANQTKITNCHISGGAITANERVGGIVGDAREYSYISNCTASDVTIKSAARFAGGIAGIFTNISTIEDCILYSGTITGTRYVGGIAAYSHNHKDGDVNNYTISPYTNDNYTTIKRCQTLGGTVESTSGITSTNTTIYGTQLFSSVGGITGACGDEPSDYSDSDDYYSHIKIINCINYAAVTGAAQNTGGVVGGNHGEIDNCHNYGTVTCTGTVSDTTLDNVDALRIGGIVGRSLCSGVITNCNNYGEIITSARRVGGIVGGNNSDVTNCHNTGNISAIGYSAGVVGYTQGNEYLDEYELTISECSNSVALSGATRVAGILGGSASNVHSTHIIKCWNTGNISGTGQGVGGIAGDLYGGNITNCYNTADISSTAERCGGIVGLASGTDIETCYNTGDVTSTSKAFGGIAGYMSSASSAKYCYHVGATIIGTGSTSYNNSGVIIGNANITTAATIDNCYYITQSTTSSLLPEIGNSESSYVTNVASCANVSALNSSALVSSGYFTAGSPSTHYLPSVMGENIYYEGDNNVDDIENLNYVVEDGTYYIYTGKGLAAFRDAVNNEVDNTGSSLLNAKLMNDIDISSYKSVVTIFTYKDVSNSEVVDGSSITGWMPIGLDKSQNLGSIGYSGTFDGGGYTISGLYINTAWQKIGLFGTLVTSATVKNVILDSPEVISSSFRASILAGAANSSSATIEGCKVINGSLTGTYSFGGIVAYCSSVVIRDCSFNGTISSSNSSNYAVGGICGLVTGTTVVERSYVSGTISAKSNNGVGGIAGQCTGSITISECYNAASISGSYNVGGIVGSASYTYASRPITINGCYNSGEVNQSTTSTLYKGTVGGIVGYFSSTESTSSLSISGCYNVGALADNWSSTDLGGILGSQTAEYVTLNSNYYIPEGGAGVGAYAATDVAGQVESVGYSTLNSQATVDAMNTAASSSFSVAADGYLPSLMGEQIIYTGTGTGDLGYYIGSDGTWSIYTGAGLKAFTDYVNQGGDNLKTNGVLTSDIDLSAYSSGEGWSPIGSTTLLYTGSFNGDNYGIYNLVINRSVASNQGLFGCVGAGATIKNVYLDKPIVNGGGTLGAVIGSANSDGTTITIANCKAVNSAITAIGSIAGGIVGDIKNNTTVANCAFVGGTIKAESSVGGIVGYAQSAISVSSCYNSGSVEGATTSSNYGVGGVVGYVKSSFTIERCYNIGGVTGGSVGVGGIAGYTDGTSSESLTITACYSAGDVKIETTGSYVGGILGYSNNSISIAIKGCYNAGVVKNAATTTDLGSISGASTVATLTGCYYIPFSSARVGVYGVTDSAGNVEQVYFDALNTAEIVYYMNQAAGSTYFTVNRDGYLPSLLDERVLYAPSEEVI